MVGEIKGSKEFDETKKGEFGLVITRRFKSKVKVLLLSRLDKVK